MNKEEYFKIMKDLNREEDEIKSRLYDAETHHSLYDEESKIRDELYNFYKKKNNQAVSFMKDMLSNNEHCNCVYNIKDKVFINDPILDKVTIDIGENEQFTFFPSRIKEGNIVADFVNANAENNPIALGIRSYEDISTAYEIRKEAQEIKNQIAESDLLYCSSGDIADKIIELMPCMPWNEGTPIGRKDELFLTTLRFTHLTDQGIPMPSDAEVANIIRAYNEDGIDLNNIMFTCRNLTGLYHEFQTYDEVMEYFGYSLEQAQKLFEEEGDVIYYNEAPYDTYLVFKDGELKNETDGFEEFSEEELQAIYQSDNTQKETTEIDTKNEFKNEKPKSVEELIDKINQIHPPKSEIQDTNHDTQKKDDKDGRG